MRKAQESIAKKPLVWGSALLGGLTSKAITGVTKSKDKKQNEEISSDDEPDRQLEDSEIFDRLGQHIETFLDVATKEWGARSEALATITKNMFEASEWMNSLSRGSKNAYEMLKSTKFHNVTSTAAEICAVMGRTHWAGAGFLVLAAIISRIHNAQGVDKKCLELLKSINMVGKTLARFTRLPLIPEEMKSTVNEARNLTARSAACCLSIIDSSRFSKFMSSKKNDELVSQCCKQLERLQREITFQVSIISFTERHEVSSVFSKKRKHAEASQTKESTSHGDDSTIANDQGKPKGKSSILYLHLYLQISLFMSL
ncbi:uncharacterized protein LOC131056353 [Cryptomeria japonica]|uniref:uncharacterized protein LOC131056353 n=1 Tax=Cryptomeria japonica TaxID=3369 RepID=UPI0027DA56E0|nr:uncharacterized protein LOC131056353 [Cryptomeria japonica]